MFLYISNMLDKHISLNQRTWKLQMEIIYKIQLGNHITTKRREGIEKEEKKEGEGGKSFVGCSILKEFS